MIIMFTDHHHPALNFGVPDSPSAALDADVCIVGSGPAGLFAAYYAGLRDLSVTIVDALEEPGGQPASLYPDKSIYDVAAHPDISGRELVGALLAQIAPAKTAMLLGHTVVMLRGGQGQDATAWRLLTDRGATIDCRVVVLATGAGSFRPRRLPCAEGHLDRGACLTTAAPERASGRDVVVLGGGDSAIDCALALERTARSVTVIHRSERFRCHERSLAELRAAPIDLPPASEVVACHGDPDLEAITVRDIRDRSERVCPATLLVVSLGMITRPAPMRDWGLDVDGPRIRVGQDMQTSLAGVFAIGDVATYPGKVPLIVTGFGDAATAINNAAAHMRPGAGVEPGHSTDRPTIRDVKRSTR
jgi:thioredoxin reductase (NADPH)